MSKYLPYHRPFLFGWMGLNLAVKGVDRAPSHSLRNNISSEEEKHV